MSTGDWVWLCITCVLLVANVVAAILYGTTDFGDDGSGQQRDDGFYF